MNTTELDSALYVRMIRNGAANLNRNRSYVNELNVFPVPDGDTGDNMYMTIDSGSAAAEKAEEGSLDRIAKIVAEGMLLGARGNSGVILSRIFYGIARNMEGNERADVRQVAKALKGSIEDAYKAVSRPVEGTILSVYRDAVNYVSENVENEHTLEDLFEDFLQELKASLARTPELLDVLKEAGVVDSGGAGIVCIMEGMQKALNGETIESETRAERQGGQLDLSLFTEDSDIGFGYCTEFLLRLQRKKVDLDSFDVSVISDWLNRVGDSVVCFRDGSVVKAHVHTKTPGEILNHMQQYGEFLTLKIENMTLQHSGTVEKTEERHLKLHKRYGFVTVASGRGIRELFRDFGADEVIEGGQSMNPSAADFLEAFRNIDADVIFVLPNNSNVILTAKQAASLYEGADIRIIETRSIGEGYSVLSMIDTNAEPGEIEEAAKESIGDCVTGMVSIATRDTLMNGIEVHAGDRIGFSDDVIYADDNDANGAALILAEKLGAKQSDILMIIYGEEVGESDAKALKNELENRYPRTEITLFDGGQPIYDYILVLE